MTFTYVTFTFSQGFQVLFTTLAVLYCNLTSVGQRKTEHVLLIELENVSPEATVSDQVTFLFLEEAALYFFLTEVPLAAKQAAATATKSKTPAAVMSAAFLRGGSRELTHHQSLLG